MKSFLLFLALMVCVAVNAQDTKKEVKISSLSLSSGNGPLSAGLLFEANFTRGNDLFNLTLGERDMYAFYLKSTLKSKLLIGPCLEYYHNIPTVSGIAIASPFKHLSTFSWLGYSAGKPDMKVELANWQFLFFYQSLDLSYGQFGASGAIMYFGGWIPMLDFKYKQPIMDKVNLFTSAGYNFSGSGSALLRLGIIYNW
jgi:hypothetical protein